MNPTRYCYAIVAVILLTTAAGCLAASDGPSELRPALPVHIWREGQHLMGLLTVEGAGGLHFASLVAEKSAEPGHPGYWIEEWKVGKLRRICPEALRPFGFSEQIVVSGIRYLWVLPAVTGGLPGHAQRPEARLLPGNGAHESLPAPSAYRMYHSRQLGDLNEIIRIQANLRNQRFECPSRHQDC